jgi:hypothetical protein
LIKLEDKLAATTRRGCHPSIKVKGCWGGEESKALEEDVEK